MSFGFLSGDVGGSDTIASGNSVVDSKNLTACFHESHSGELSEAKGPGRRNGVAAPNCRAIAAISSESVETMIS